jgi:DNA-directed RNA polymerase subunit RPC12/RpoP
MEQQHCNCCGPAKVKKTFAVSALAPFQCQWWGRNHGLRNQLLAEKTVLESDPREFLCDKCGKLYLMQHQLEEHTERIHNFDDDRYPCKDCGKRFHDKHQLNKHVISVHENVRPHDCPADCGKKFSLKGNLDQHFLEIHCRKNYSCGTCGKTFVNPRSIGRHVRTVHIGLTPYSCHLCPASFRLQQHLQQHLKIIHEKMISYTCAECPSKFDQHKDLQQHMETEHNFACQHNNNNDFTIPHVPNNTEASSSDTETD